MKKLPKCLQQKSVDRILDANFNRLKEGLRVCEEIARFVIKSPVLSADFKKIRHRVDFFFGALTIKFRLLKERDSDGDPGRNIHLTEVNRSSCRDIFFANIQRAKESARVLEEFSKLSDKNTALRFKSIRYAIYGLEKKTAAKLVK